MAVNAAANLAARAPQAAQKSFTRWLLWVLVLLACAEFAWRGPVRNYQLNHNHQENDFTTFYSAARAWSQGSNPYDLENLRQVLRSAGGPGDASILPSVNPPVTLPLLAPVALLPFQQSVALWNALQAVLLAALVWSLVRLISPQPRYAYLLLAFFAIALGPVQTSVGMGQLALPACALIVLGVLADARGRFVAAALLMTLATALKPQLGALPLLVVLARGGRRSWVAAGALGAAILAAGILPLQANNVPWFSSLHSATAATFAPGAINDPSPANPRSQLLLNLQYPLGLIAGGGFWTSVAGTATGLAIAMLGALRLRARRDAAGIVLLYSLVSLGSLLAMYHRFYDAAVLVLPMAWAVPSLQGPDRKLAVAMLLLALPFLLPGAVPAAMPALEHLRENWAWRCLVMPARVYLLVLMAGLLAKAAVASRAAAPVSMQEGRQ